MLREKILIISKVLKGSLLVIFLIILSSFVIHYKENRINIKLDSCVDGDTAWFIINGNREKVRFLGVDAPESTNIKEEYGEDASKYTCNVLKNASNIYIEYDDNSSKYDKYNRLLGWVFVDDKNVSELLVTNGLAEVKYIYGDYKYVDNLCSLQYDVYLNKIGIWNSYDYTLNYCYKDDFS